MRLVYITPCTPCEDNINGPSAHPFHLMVERDKDIEVIFYTFNTNFLSKERIERVEKELNATIKVMKLPRWYKWVMKYKLQWLRALIPYPFLYYLKLDKATVEEIKALKPDGIGTYCSESSQIIKQFPGYRRVHMLPDCVSLYYHRMMEQRFVLSDKKMFFKQWIMYPKFVRLERNYENDPSVRYYLVGDADAARLRAVNPGIDAHFVHHPHYEVFKPEKVIKFEQPRIRLVLAGKHDLYMAQTADEVVEALCGVDDLQAHYHITFLGRGWNAAAKRLTEHGYDVETKGFVKDYKAELVKHDIQLTPITIGTGTKGKVLDALANGLLVIGTYYAMENIAVEDGVSCITFDTATACWRCCATSPRACRTTRPSPRLAARQCSPTTTAPSSPASTSPSTRLQEGLTQTTQTFYLSEE